MTFRGGDILAKMLSQRIKRAIITISTACALSACSAYGNGTLPRAQRTVSAVPPSVATGLPKPWDPSDGYTPKPMGSPHPGNRNKWQDHRLPVPRPRTTQADEKQRKAMDTVTQYDTGGYYGFNPMSAVGAYGTYVAMGVYEAQYAPNSTIGPNFVQYNPQMQHLLYAPTTKPVNFGCIEFGIDYDNALNTNTEARFFVADWCTPGGKNAAYMYNGSWQPGFSYWTINDGWYARFVRTYTNGDGYPEVVAEELYNSSDGKWHLLVWAQGDNNGSGAWVDAYDSSGTDHSPVGQTPAPGYTAAAGWSIFETHYNLTTLATNPTISDCGAIPTISESGLRQQMSVGSSTWNYATVFTPSNPISSNQLQQQCFAPNSVPFYGTGYSQPDLFWWVDTNNIRTSQYAINQSTGWQMFTADATETYSCTYDDVEARGACSPGSATDWTYASPSDTVVDTTHPIGIQLNSMSNNGSCGDGLSYTVSLLDPSGATVYSSGSQTAASFYASYNGTTATGSWKWVVDADDQRLPCAQSISSNGTYDDTATGSGSINYSTNS